VTGLSHKDDKPRVILEESYRCEISHIMFSYTDSQNYHTDHTNHHHTEDKQLDPLGGLPEEERELLKQEELALKKEPSDIAVEEEIQQGAPHECDRVQLDSIEPHGKESDHDGEQLSSSDSTAADKPTTNHLKDDWQNRIDTFRLAKMATLVTKHREEFIWTCDKCDFTTDEQKECHKHINDEHSEQDPERERRFKCELCSHSFSKYSYLEFHVSGVHDNGRNNVCHICGFFTSMPASLIAHIKTVHDDDKVKIVQDKASSSVKFQCPHCSFACSQKEYLKIHNKVKHTKDKNYMCELCGYSTYYQGNFKRHKDEVHPGIKEKIKYYTCDICGYSTRNQGNLKRHKDDVHFNIKNHLCTICGQAFAQKKKMEIHMKKHKETPGTSEPNSQSNYTYL
jgi:hypothetical protein